MTRPVHRAAVAAALFCAACAAPSPDKTTDVPKPQVSAAQDAPDVDPPQATPRQDTAAAPPAAPQRRRVTPAALLGLAEKSLAELMGAPGFKRVDDPAALWQYRGPRCILDVFLYADGPVYRVAHLEFRETGAGVLPMEGKAAEVCLSGLLPDAGAKG